MAIEAELKKQRVFTTGNGVAKPVWKNANRVNHANHFISRPVQINTVRQNVNSGRPNVNTGRANVNSVKTNVNSVRHNVNSVRHNVNFVRTNVNINLLGFLLGLTKDETNSHLKNFIRQIENQLNLRVKIIRSYNDTEFKNRDMLEFCENKGIKQEYSNARTPQQNEVAERMNMTLIEAAKTMLADNYFVPSTFWAEAVSTALLYLLIGSQAYASKVGTRKNLLIKAEEFFFFFTELKTLKTQEKEAYSTGISEDTPKILAFRRDLDELALNHLREVPKNKATRAHALDHPLKNIEELLQFRPQHVWILVDLPHGAKVIGTKWVYRNKWDERG
ncbi:putative ribonuclease H-like domain-containing protein [Tanacetum coccineum]